jgi:hypothetical protein
MEHKEDMTAQLLGLIMAQGALLEGLLIALRPRLAGDAGIDTVFAHARGEFAKEHMVGSGGETAHTALAALESMQTRVIGRARSMS